MPIYEYECPTCGRFEVMQKISDPALSSCPTCQGAGRNNAVQRLVSASAFHLKGSGWYKTDYSAKNGAAKESTSSSSTSTTAATDSNKPAKSESATSETKTTSSDSGPSSSGSGGCGGGCKCH